MENIPGFQTDPSLKLMERVEQALEHYQYAERTRISYRRWIRVYILYLGKRNIPESRFQKEIGSFLKHLVREKKLSMASRDQARNAIVFLYKRVFDISIPYKNKPLKKRTRQQLPVVMTQNEVSRFFKQMNGRHLLMAKLMYGSGLRLMECIRLRIDQLNFLTGTISLYSSGRDKIRETLIPGTILQELIAQVEAAKRIHRQDLEKGYGKTQHSGKVSETYHSMGMASGMQYLFPAKKIKTDPGTGKSWRPCVLESGLQKAVKKAAERAGIEKRVSAGTLRHTFATHLLENNVNIYVVQKLMGHADIKTTQVYTRVMEKREQDVLSPLDTLGSGTLGSNISRMDRV